MPAQTPSAGFGDDQNEDVLDKLDRLLTRHRPGTVQADPAGVPVLTESPADDSGPATSAIPVLTDIVARPGQRAAPPAQPETESPDDIDPGLAAAILRRLFSTLRAERARLLAEIGEDVARARVLEQIMDDLERALPGAILSAMSGGASEQDDGRL